MYLAHDTQLDRQVAIKFARIGRHPTTDSADRILAEARAAARLHHPGVCPVFDADVCDGVPYLTMAFVQGPNLAAELKRLGPCPPDYAAKLVRAIAEAMQYAHEHGVIHRDLKPGNILLTAEHTPIVTDFGLAVRLDREGLAHGVVSGTPHYMAPEQAAGDAANIGERTDVFALGVILFEMLTGRVPFDGNAREVLEQVRAKPVPPVRKLRKNVPDRLARIVAKATARNPADRFNGMGAFADALTDFLRIGQIPKKKKALALAFWLAAIPAGMMLGLCLLCVGLGFLLPAIQKMQDAGSRHKATLTEEERKLRVEELLKEGEEDAKSGMPERALEKYSEAAELDPVNPDPRQLRARLLDKLERHGEALADWSVAIRLGPGNAWYRFHRANLFIRMKRFPQALEDAEYVLKSNPDETGCLLLRAEVRYELREYAEALVDLNRAVKLTEGIIVLESDETYYERPVAFYLRALTKAALRDRKGAEEDMAVAKEDQGKMPARFRERVRWNDWKLPDPPSPPAPIPPPSPGK